MLYLLLIDKSINIINSISILFIYFIWLVWVITDGLKINNNIIYIEESEIDDNNN